MRVCAHLPALRVHRVDRLDRVQVVHPRVESGLVQHYDPRAFDLVLEFADSGADVARRHDVCLAFDRRLDDVDVVGVRDEGDDEVVLCHRLLEGGLLSGIFEACIERLGSSVGEVGCQSFCALEGAASYVITCQRPMPPTRMGPGQRTDGERIVGVAYDVLRARTGNSAAAEQENLLRLGASGSWVKRRRGVGKGCHSSEGGG